MKYRELIKKHPHIAMALQLGTNKGNQLAVQIAYAEGRNAGYIEGSEMAALKADQAFRRLEKESEDRIAGLKNDGSKQ